MTKGLRRLNLNPIREVINLEYGRIISNNEGGQLCGICDS